MASANKTKNSSGTDPPKDQAPLKKVATEASSLSSSPITYSEQTRKMTLQEVKVPQSHEAIDVSKTLKGDISQLFCRLKGYVSNSAFLSQADSREAHSLVKGTMASFGDLGRDICEIARALGIKVSEDVGDAVQPNLKLIGCFKNGTFNDESIKSDKVLLDAALELSSLAHNLAVFDNLPNFLNSENLSLMYTRFWYVRHIQRIWFTCNPSDYSSVSRISKDYRSELVAKLKVFNSVTASGQFVDLIEKIIEKIVFNIYKNGSKEQKDNTLSCCLSHFFSMSKTFEKVLPKSQKVSLSDTARRRLARNSNARISDKDKTVTLVVVRPTLETKGFLDDPEKLQLKAFNQKLNEISKAVPELPTADGSARKSTALQLQKSLFQKVATINTVVHRRKTIIHGLMVQNRRSSQDPLERRKIEDRIPFTPQEWRDAFKAYDKSDLQDALIAAFNTVKAEHLDLNRFVRSLMHQYAQTTSFISSSSEAEDMNLEPRRIGDQADS